MFFRGEIAEIPETSSLRRNFHFPIFFLLLPQIAAFALCAEIQAWAEIPPLRWLIAGTFFLALAAILLLAENSGKIRAVGVPAKFPIAGIWKTIFPIAAFFVFGFWWQIFGAPPLVDWSKKPPRDAEFVLRVERSFSGAAKNFNGFARVEKVFDERFAPLAGTRVWFAFPKKFYPENVSAPAEGMRFRGNGIVRGISAGNASRDEKRDDGFREFLQRERASAIFSRVENPEIVDGGISASVRRFFPAGKSGLLALLKRVAADDSGELSRAGRTFGAMLLGERSLLSPEQKENFLLAGTTHIFAVSGLHISILAAGLLRVLRILRVRFVPASIAVSAVLLFYVLTIGAPPSAMRAWMMSVFIFAGRFFGRGRMAFHGLLFAAFVALSVEPEVLFNVGFQLSYFVVAAILLYGIPLARIFEKAVDARAWVPESAMSFPRRAANFCVREISGGCAVSFAAFLAGAPLVVATFGICSFVSLPANIVLIPVVSVAACLGAFSILSAAIPFAGTFLGKCVFFVASIPLNIVDFASAELAKISAGIVEISFPNRGFGIAGGILLLLIFFFGETFPPLRSRAWLRFVLPPLALTVFLTVFAF